MGRVKLHPRRFMLAFVCLFFSASLVGCMITRVKMDFLLHEGNHIGVVQQLVKDQYNYSEYKTGFQWKLCRSIISVGVYDEFFRCYDVLKKGVDANDGKVVSGPLNIEQNKAASRAKMASLLAYAHFGMRDYDKALKYAHQVEKLIDTSRFGYVSPPVTMGSLFTVALVTIPGIPAFGIMAQIYGERGDVEKSLHYINRLNALKVDALYTQQYDGERRGWRARSYMAIGDYESAYREVMTETLVDSLTGRQIIRSNSLKLNATLALEEILNWAVGLKGPTEMAVARGFEARFMRHHIELKLGKLALARKGYDEILTYPLIDGKIIVLYGALHGRGLVALAEKDLDGAISFLKRAIDVMERQRASIITEKNKIGFIGDKQTIYRDLIAALVELGRVDEAFEYAERGKARALVDLLASKKSFGKDSAGKIKAKLAELDRLERKSLKLAALKNGSDTRSVKIVKRTLKQEMPKVASLVSVTTDKPSDIQSLLRPDEAIVEYFYHGEGNKDADDLFAFVVTRDAIKAVTLDAKGLNDEVKAFRTAINKSNSNGWSQGASSLHRRLIAPLVSAIKGKKNLTIVPHGALHYLPFNALKANGGEFLIQDHTIRLLPSASVMKFLNKGSAPTQSLLVFGNPDLNDPNMDLPGAETEAKAIAKLWPDSKVVLRKHASESLIKKTASVFRYIHLASHGQFKPDAPMQSRMLLAADNDNDGSLTVSEIYDLKLNADMVVLSACQTALGDVKNGDDVVGLNRGFLYAGAKSIVGSLWEVPDNPTKDLMVGLYTNLKSMGLREAMRKAQLFALKKYKHPFNWAAFQVTGGT
ncbi:MAG TPA: CHAT domain-containing protein [Rhodospirillales bacterium]|nr:CHAT domain-containing protein [Rhodospirillales bacterium]